MCTFNELFIFTKININNKTLIIYVTNLYRLQHRVYRRKRIFVLCIKAGSKDMARFRWDTGEKQTNTPSLLVVYETKSEIRRDSGEILARNKHRIILTVDPPKFFAWYCILSTCIYLHTGENFEIVGVIRRPPQNVCWE